MSYIEATWSILQLLSLAITIFFVARYAVDDPPPTQPKRSDAQVLMISVVANLIVSFASIYVLTYVF